MPYPNEHSCELGSGNYDRYRRENCQRKHDGKCIDTVWGIKGDETEVSSLRYKADIWSESAARSHCNDEGGTFEPATGEEESDRSRFPDNRARKPWYTMQADEDSAEIEIFDEIGGWWGIEVGQFKKDFDKIKNRKAIKVLINSPGGSVFDSMAIYNILAGYKAKITTEIIGLAASGASIIALAGKTRNICQGCYFMIHDPYGFCMGPAEDMQKMAENLAKIGGQIANLYSRNSNLMKDDIVEKMHEETWFTAEEAVEAGFADNLLDYGEMAAMAFDISKFNNVPERVKALAARQSEKKPAPEPEPEPAEPETGGKTMPESKEKDEAKIAALEAENASLKAELAESKAEVEKEKGKTVLVLSEKQAIAKELAELKASTVQAEKLQLIEATLKDGRITPKNRQKWEEMFDKDPEGTKALLDSQEPVVDLSVHGTGAGGEEGETLDAADTEALRIFAKNHPELSAEEARKQFLEANKEK